MKQNQEKKQSALTQAPEPKRQPQSDLSQTWNSDSLEELEDWIEEQGIQLRY